MPENAAAYSSLVYKRSLSIPIPTLTLGDDPLAQVDSYRYLGVLITSNLVWSTHIMNICNKTRRLIGILYRHAVLQVLISRYNVTYVLLLYPATSRVCDGILGPLPQKGY